MNEKRRNRLKEAIQYLELAESIIQDAWDEENDRIENVPENLQSSERFDTMLQIAEYLSDAIDNLEEAKQNVQSAVR